MSGPEAAQPARQRRAPLRHNLATVLAYVPNRGALAVIGFASFLAGLLEAGSLLLLARAAIGVTSGESRIALGPVDLGRGTALAIAAGFLVAKLAVNVFTASIAAGLAAQTLSSHRAALLRAFHRASWSTQSALPSGRMQDVVTVQIERASEAVLALGSLVNALLALAVLVASSLVVSPLGAAAVIVGGVALSALFRPLTSRTRTFVGQQARAGQRFASAVAEATSVARDARTTGVDDALVARTMAASDEQLPAYRRARVLGQLIGPVYQSFALLLLIGAVAGLTLVGGDDSGTVGSLGVVVLLLLRAVSYGQLAQQGVHQIAEKAAYLDEVATTEQSLGVDSVPSGGRDAPATGRLELRSVSFAYSDGDGDGVLRDLDVRVEPGETIGVAGPSGSGKTTLVRLLLRLLDPTSGCITFGDADLRTISLDAWYRAVAFVPQDPRFLTSSVADNIAMLRPVSRERIEQAARLANLDDEIRGLPQGYDTVVGPGGVALSGGQQQRLAFARALAVDPALLVLDEPTSALDAVSEALIHETLGELHGSVTTVIVAHRLSTLGVCDRILVLRDGGVEAFGAHHELLQSSPFYAAAVRLSALPD